MRTLLFLLGVSLVWIPTADAQTDSTAVADSLTQELARHMATMQQPSQSQQRPPVSASAISANPDISLIGDARARFDSDSDRPVDGGVHEVEISLRSAVDPYARADVFLSVHDEDGEFAFELEEAYLTTLSLPYRLQARIGKFRSTVGKTNRLHPHSLSYIDVPLVYENLFGHEGLNDQGISMNWLLPNNRFYQEATLEITRGPAENESFAFDEGGRLLYTGHLRNFWDMSRDATLELGFTGIHGANDLGHTTRIGGVDLTYKWKPLQFNTSRSLTVQTEIFVSRREMDTDAITASGFYGLVGWQLARRWVVTGRYDHADLPEDPDWNQKAGSLTLGWLLSEFQKLEFGIRSTWGPDLDRSTTGLVRLVFVIGTHGAHAY